MIYAVIGGCVVRKSMFYPKIQIKNNKNNKQGLCNTVMQMICETLIYLKQVSDAACQLEDISLCRYPKRKLRGKNRKRKIIKINRLKKSASAAGYYTAVLSETQPGCANHVHAITIELLKAGL